MNDKETFNELLNASVPSPKERITTAVLESNGWHSLIKKEDGTFAIRNETSHEEYGHFLTKEEAFEEYTEITMEE